MNVLPLVFVMISLVTIITYSRLQNYLVHQSVDKQYAVEYQSKRWEEANRVERERYEDTHVLEHKGGGDRGPNVQATRKCSLSTLMKDQPDLANATFTRQLFKNLLDQLFGDKLFYKEAVAENPLIIDQIINSLKGRDLPKENSDLLALPFDDPAQRQFWYHLFQKPPKEVGKEDLDDKKSRSFIDLVTVKDFEKPIRLYLTSKEILVAIFQSEALADEVIAKRNELRTALACDKSLQQSLGSDFEAAFRTSLPSWVAPSCINWDVTSTKE